MKDGTDISGSLAAICIHVTSRLVEVSSKVQVMFLGKV